MEVFVWHLANADGSDFDSSAYAHLPDFLIDVDDFVRPLFAILLPEGQKATDLKVLDKTVFRDPQFNAYPPVANKELLEIKRVNPELIRLLAKVTPKKLDGVADDWFVAAQVRDFMLRWRDNPDEESKARDQLRDVLRGLIKLAKKAVRVEKDVMERFWHYYDG